MPLKLLRNPHSGNSIFFKGSVEELSSLSAADLSRAKQAFSNAGFEISGKQVEALRDGLVAVIERETAGGVPSKPLVVLPGFEVKLPSRVRARLFFPLKIKFSNGIVSIVHQPAIHGIGDFKKKFSGDTFEILKKIAVEGFTPHTPPNAFIPFETFVSSPYADPSSGLITKETTGDSFSIAFSGPVLGSSFLPSVSEGFVGAAPPQRIIRVLIKLRRGLSGASEAQAKAFYRRELSRLGLPVSFVTRETTEHHRVVSIDL